MKIVRADMANAGPDIDEVREVVPGEVYLYFDDEGLLSQVLLIGVTDVTSEETALVYDLDLALQSANGGM